MKLDIAILLALQTFLNFLLINYISFYLRYGAVLRLAKVKISLKAVKQISNPTVIIILK